MKKWIYFISSLVSFLFICSFFIIEFAAPTPVEIAAYLTKEQKYNTQSEKLLNDLLEGNTANIALTNSKQTELLKKVIDLKTPSSMKEHKQDLINVIAERIDIITYLSKTKEINSIPLTKKRMELKIQQELARESLLNTFEKEQIKYVLKEDGTIQY